MPMEKMGKHWRPRSPRQIPPNWANWEKLQDSFRIKNATRCPGGCCRVPEMMTHPEVKIRPMGRARLRSRFRSTAPRWVIRRARMQRNSVQFLTRWKPNPFTRRKSPTSQNQNIRCQIFLLILCNQKKKILISILMPHVVTCTCIPHMSSAYVELYLSDHRKKM